MADRPDANDRIADDSAVKSTFGAPHPGSSAMPRWEVAELTEAPTFTWRNWFAMLGPGLLMGGAAIGGGEWLVGPMVTAKYGGALMWLATISILSQVLYNIEISRYTLYTGEPIFTGKFRTLPGPMFWLFVYLVLDFGAVFPYLAANAATPLAAVILGGEIPDPENNVNHFYLMKGLGYAIFLTALIPLIIGGKIYNVLKGIMTFKIVVVLGFLLILAVFYSSWSTWGEIFSGFVKFGNVPVQRAEDLNNNNRLDPGEDWDGDNNLDCVEPRLLDIHAIKPEDWPDLDRDGQGDKPVDTDGDGVADSWGDLNGDGKPEKFVDEDGDGHPDQWPDIVVDPKSGKPDGKADTFIDIDGDGFRDGDNVDNLFVALFRGGLQGTIDLTLIGFIAALAAIAGSGGLSNTPVSNYTRDQGWGMGHHVGAIPSVIGGHNIQLSHVGKVFQVTDDSLPRWRRWYKHVVRDQVFVWMPACFVGLALPSMLSVEYLRRGYEADNWTAAAMTAAGVEERVTSPPSGTWIGQFISGEGWGDVFWFMTLFCGFLVLAPSMASSIDGIVRRWVDVFWTGSRRLRQMDPAKIRNVYFYVLAGYSVFGMIMLTVGKPVELMKYATIIFNYALGFSCLHSLALNLILLPRELRPGWLIRIGMVLAGLFFTLLAVITTLKELGII